MASPVKLQVAAGVVVLPSDQCTVAPSARLATAATAALGDAPVISRLRGRMAGTTVMSIVATLAWMPSNQLALRLSDVAVSTAGTLTLPLLSTLAPARPDTLQAALTACCASPVKCACAPNWAEVPPTIVPWPAPVMASPVAICDAVSLRATSTASPLA